MDVAETLRELEASLLTNAVRKDRARVDELLAEEFREFGRSGTAYTKAEILTFLQEEEEIRVTMKEFACKVVAEGVALVTYLGERTEPNGETIEALRSSLWAWRGQRWQMVFHQGTPLGTSVARRVKA
jgi:hypothetical protein